MILRVLEGMSSITEIAGIILTAIGLLFSYVVYNDKKKSKRFESIDKRLGSCEEKASDMDKKVSNLSMRTEINEKHVSEQFALVKETQLEMKEVFLAQIGDIKGLIEKISQDLKTYFAHSQEMQIKLIEHIAKTEK